MIFKEFFKQKREAGDSKHPDAAKENLVLASTFCLLVVAFIQHLLKDTENTFSGGTRLQTVLMFQSWVQSYKMYGVFTNSYYNLPVVSCYSSNLHLVESWECRTEATRTMSARSLSSFSISPVRRRRL